MQIALSDPHHTTYSVRDEIAGLEPPADRTARNADAFRDLGDREEPDLIVAVTATADLTLLGFGAGGEAARRFGTSEVAAHLVSDVARVWVPTTNEGAALAIAAVRASAKQG